MYITLETDYAIRIVDCLAREGRRMGAQAIADKTGVTLRFSLKILRKLVNTGILKSFKGAQGGYEVARPLNQISINDILTTIETDYKFSRCLDEDHICHRNVESQYCPYHFFFQDISQEMETKLKAATLDRFISVSTTR